MEKILTVRIKLKASQVEVIEIAPNQLTVKLTAAPTKGKANEQLIKLLAKHFNIAPSQIEIVKGLTSKNKIIKVNFN